ncbi:protein kinase [Mycobacterium europaeum]|uniref:serine/threonine-protein kinase n=1 Tax=Mycobacterium europaeum TaxID=761804 RepID=UPI002ADF192C|nr:protein kinase [Mycobacterium europaeum]MEA1162826.1 protein kinase [Mycobacterium europaeum]
MNDAVRDSLEGLQFGHYRLKRLLGHGATGEVYEAEDTLEQRIVALKLLPLVFSHDPAFCARLQRQVHAVSRLHAPHIVPIHHCGEIDGQQFLEMRLIEGDDLSRLLRRPETLTAPGAVSIVRQIASALDAAHAAGVIHGDVKPENILIARNDFAYLTDLGITDVAARKGVARIVGSAIGTWKYTAPERFSAPRENHQIDIYALTCVLYECLTGSPPYCAHTPGALISAHLAEPIPRPSQLHPEISPAFDEVIARGMAKDPIERYSSAGDLALAAYDALGAADQALVAEILTLSEQAAGPDAELAVPPSLSAPSAPTVPTPSAVSMSATGPAPHPSADPPFLSVAESVTERLSTAESTGTPGTLPRFGLGGTEWPSEFGAGPSSPRPASAKPRNPRRRLLFGAAAVVAVVVLGGVASWLIRPSHPASTVSGAHSSTSPAPVPASSDTEIQARLIGMLPRGYPPGTCKPIAAPSAALAKVSCGTNSDPDGPVSATYLLFPDENSARAAFDQIVQAATVVECPGRIQSPGPWHRNATPDKTSGMLVCGTQQENPMVAWTDDAELLVGVVNGQPQGPTLDQLYAWWMSHS